MPVYMAKAWNIHLYCDQSICRSSWDHVALVHVSARFGIVCSSSSVLLRLSKKSSGSPMDASTPFLNRCFMHRAMIGNGILPLFTLSREMVVLPSMNFVHWSQTCHMEHSPKIKPKIHIESRSQQLCLKTNIVSLTDPESTLTNRSTKGALS